MLKPKKIISPKNIFLITVLLSILFINIKNIKIQADINEDSTLEVSDSVAPFFTHGKRVVRQPLQQDRIIYYKITGDNKNARIWKAAVNRWNNLKVIKFVEADNNYDGYSINLHSNYDDHSLGDLKRNSKVSDSVKGTTIISNIKYSNAKVNTPAFCNSTQAYLYNNIKKIRYATRVNVATHELDHVLGFDHDNSKVKVGHNKLKVIMNSVLEAKMKPLGNYEKKTLEEYYPN